MIWLGDCLLAPAHQCSSSLNAFPQRTQIRNRKSGSSSKDTALASEFIIITARVLGNNNERGSATSAALSIVRLGEYVERVHRTYTRVHQWGPPLRIALLGLAWLAPIYNSIRPRGVIC